MNKIMIFGTFDRLHEGHLFVLGEALKRGSVTVVVARSQNVKRIKGLMPIESDEARLKAVRDVSPALQAVLGDPADFLTPVRTVKPDLILLGYDQKLPPGVKESDLGAPIERLEAFHPELFKSSLRRTSQKNT